MPDNLMILYFLIVIYFFMMHSFSWCDDMGFNTGDINNINLDDDDAFDEDEPESINYVTLIAWRNWFKQRKTCKKEISKELVTVA